MKHKAILMFIYSAGLRVDEVVRLKPEEIDSKRMLIHVRWAKGRKDGYSILSENALRTLRMENRRTVRLSSQIWYKKRTTRL